MRRRSKKRQAALEQRHAVRSVPPAEERRARPGTEDPGLQEFVRRLPCVVCLAPSLGGDPCHRLARRRFGDWVEVGGETIGNIYPACRAHHREQHDHGTRTFERVHGVNLEAVCRVVGAAYLAGWSATGLGAAATRRGYADADIGRLNDGDLPF